MPDRTKYALTDAQKDELQRLWRSGAVDRDHAVSAYDGGMLGANPNVIGILLDKGYALKRVRSRSGTSRTVYWLTVSGCDLAVRIVADVA